MKHISTYQYPLHINNVSKFKKNEGINVSSIKKQLTFNTTHDSSYEATTMKLCNLKYV